MNLEKVKSYVETAWKYYAKWAFVRRHITLFSMYLGAVSTITIGISGMRASIKNDPNSASSLEIFIGENGWPEVCIISLLTIALFVIAYFMERKSFLVHAENDYE